MSGFNQWLAMRLGNTLSSMSFFYICVLLDLIELQPVIAAHDVIVWCTYLSQTVIQLIALPILSAQNKASQEHHSRHSDKLDQILIHARASAQHREEETHPLLTIDETGIVRAAKQRPYDRLALRDALIQNRGSRSKGSGKEYWDSVILIIEKQLNLYPRI